MSAVTHARYRDARANAFRRVLAAWLAKLPSAWWEGGVEELGDQLLKIACRDPVPTHVPFGSGVGRVIAAEQGVIRTQGFSVEHRRTKRGPTMRFTRIPSPGESCARKRESEESLDVFRTAGRCPH